MSRIIVRKEFAPDPDYPKITLEATDEAVEKIAKIAELDDGIHVTWEGLVQWSYRLQLAGLKSVGSTNPSIHARWDLFQNVSDVVAGNLYAIVFFQNYLVRPTKGGYNNEESTI